ncbi:MAG: hypothetical protein JNK48_33525 [Bryobacterales bacterium]|nr:hypothetical protein [Bryobacterales bacterium]
MHTEPEPKVDSITRHLNLPAVAALTLCFTLIGSNLYLHSRSNDIEEELRQTRTAFKNELVKVQRNAMVKEEEYQRTVADLRREIEETGARSAQAETVASNASSAAKRYSDDLAKRLRNQAAALQEQHRVLSTQLGEMRNVADTTEQRVSGIASDVSAVRAGVNQARTDVDRTLSELRSVRGDMGLQSGLIATNAKELAALRALGDRDYIEFDLPKTKSPQRVGDVSMLLRKSDQKRNRFTIELIANDKTVEKKDRNINEPVQFYLARARMPYEIVVNEVRKDRIVGYMAAPKLRAAR